jgi:hypothetical protein
MEWISVKERLPGMLQKVLFHWVMLDSVGQPVIMNVSMGYLCKDGWNIYLPYHSYGLRADVCPVTHWRELPDFPKPEYKGIEVGETIIDDPLAKVQFDSDQPFKGVVFIDEPENIEPKDAKEFAKRFCEKNKELLKRLADR